MNFNIISTSIKADKFDKQASDILCGKIGGVCYMANSFNNLLNEDLQKTIKRIDQLNYFSQP